MRLITVNSRGVPVLGDPVLDRHRLPVRDRGLRLPGHRVHVPAELLRRGHPVRLPADRDLAVRAAPAHARRPAHGEDVVLPGADDPRRRRHRRACSCRWASSDDTRSQLLLSLLSWGVVLVLYAVTRWRGGSVAAGGARRRRAGAATRVLVLANQTMGDDELHDALRRHRRQRAGGVLRRASRPTRSTPARPSGRARRSCGRPPPRPRRSGWTRRWTTLREQRAHRRRRARRLPAAGRARQGDARVRARPPGDLHAAGGAVDLAAARRGLRRARAVRRAGPARRGAGDRSRVSHLDRDRAGVSDGLLEHGPTRVRHRQPGIDPHPGEVVEPRVLEHLLDRRPVAAADERSQRPGEDPLGVPGGRLVGGAGLVVPTS